MSINVNFRIEYITKWGQSIRIIYSPSPIFEDKVFYSDCKTSEGKVWTTTIDLARSQNIYYKYQILSNEPAHDEENLEIRSINAKDYTTGVKNIYIEDTWRSVYSNRKIFFASAFKDSIFKRNESDVIIHSINKIDTKNFVFSLYAPDIPKQLNVGIIGSGRQLGQWTTPQLMNYQGGKWTFLTQGLGTLCEYKYVLVDTNSGEIVKWEVGENRIFKINQDDGAKIINNEGFRFGGDWWRGCGLAIPVFSMRSREGLGIGEFSDLKLMIDLAREMNMDFLQTLPVNDTIANKMWTDSYPYAAISIYALHPMYIKISEITDLSRYTWFEEYNQTKLRLNELSVIDFEEVYKIKTKYTQAIYEDLGVTMLSKKEIKAFVAENEWVKSYSVFCHLRDLYKSPNFNNWDKYAEYNDSIIDQFWHKNVPKKEVGYYVFLQYHLDKQLKEARDYGRAQGIVLKGDLPIGIYRYSCDAWISPNLYHMDQQAGAPPDDYAIDGQNWGFPTYNWEEMSKDGFAWWRSRMTQLANYFDALRIDHILGFFRIWSIPINQASGTLGMFNPRLPFHRDEIWSYGLTGDLRRYTLPYIRTHRLNILFGERAHEVAEAVLNEDGANSYVFKEVFDNQMKLLAGIEKGPLANLSDLKEEILKLYTEVILMEEPDSNGIYFNPRITVQTTNSYQELDKHNKHVIDNLYNEYYFYRHNEYWKNQALWKLPALLNATNMFICGEDLGMIPSTVPQVMKSLNIVPLEIQRMPKGNDTFGNCRNYDYTTVCSPSCHDMSTIRGWWESNYDTAKNFYRNYMGRYEDAPQLCSTEIVEYVVQDHLHSPSMLAIFPIQDILGLDYDLRMANPHAEQINVPANPKHYWRYRLHINLEDLLENKTFCARVGNLVKASGRD